MFIKTYNKIGNILENILKVWQVLVFSISVFSITFEVFMRYVLNSPTYWSEELSRFSMVWLVLLGLGVGIRHKEHIRVDNIIEVFPESIQKIAAWLRYGFVLVFSGVLLVQGYKLIFINMHQVTPGLGIPMGLIYLSVPIGALLIIFYLVELIIEGYRGTF